MDSEDDRPDWTTDYRSVKEQKESEEWETEREEMKERWREQSASTERGQGLEPSRERHSQAEYDEKKPNSDFGHTENETRIWPKNADTHKKELKFRRFNAWFQEQSRTGWQKEKADRRKDVSSWANRLDFTDSQRDRALHLNEEVDFTPIRSYTQDYDRDESMLALLLDIAIEDDGRRPIKILSVANGGTEIEAEPTDEDGELATLIDHLDSTAGRILEVRQILSDQIKEARSES